MSTKFSEDVVPLTDLKINPGRVVKHVAEVHRPVLRKRPRIDTYQFTQ
jgi:hypothetical protein